MTESKIREILEDADFDVAVHHLENNIDKNEYNIVMINAIKLRSSMPDEIFRAFAMGWPRFTYLAAFSGHHDKFRIYLSSSTVPSAKDAHEMFAHLYLTCPQMQTMDLWAWALLHQDAQVLDAFLKTKNRTLRIGLPYLYAYIPNEMYTQLSQLDLEGQLGADFKFDVLKIGDAQTVSDNWINSDGVDTIRKTIQHFPSACIRRSADETLASWAHLVGFGCVANLFTMPQYRNQGLAKLVELHLAKTLIQKNMFAFKCVDLQNEIGVTITESSKFWKVVQGNRYHWCQIYSDKNTGGKQ